MLISVQELTYDSDKTKRHYRAKCSISSMDYIGEKAIICCNCTKMLVMEGSYMTVQFGGSIALLDIL